MPLDATNTLQEREREEFRRDELNRYGPVYHFPEPPPQPPEPLWNRTMEELQQIDRDLERARRLRLVWDRDSEQWVYRESRE